MKVAIGGKRLGDGSQMETSIRNYDRSTHDLSYVFKSTMAAGTLVPFMCEIALPGDNFEISLDCDIKTHPTIGPLFGSMKVQLDTYRIPIRLYNARLNMNELNIGKNIENIKFPQIHMDADIYEYSNSAGADIDNSQINPSSIFAYLGIRGLGTIETWDGLDTSIGRKFNGIPWLAYWDIFKSYYANKQETDAVFIHNEFPVADYAISDVVLQAVNNNAVLIEGNGGIPANNVTINANSKLVVEFANMGNFNPDAFRIYVNGQYRPVLEVFQSIAISEDTNSITWYNPQGLPVWQQTAIWGIGTYFVAEYTPNEVAEPQLATFPLENIDWMKKEILSAVFDNTAFEITANSKWPYGAALESTSNIVGALQRRYSKQCTQEGLAIKTYQSDVFNNWINTESIDGENGVNALTAIDTTGGSFTLDTLLMQRKVYDMMNRVAMSDGTYDEWQDVTYGHKRLTLVSTPEYMGGLSKELVFQEVVSTANSEGLDGQPLGTLAGRGVLAKKHKGGRVDINVNEPSYIMGIVSITPRITYSQGNRWDVNLKTMRDLHAPGLDGIGFQDLITDQMAWWDTKISQPTMALTFRSAGKQPAWINYMTNYNRVYGNFAIEGEQMFMTLNRRYTTRREGHQGTRVNIEDLTTYIDPTKYNNIFADTRLDAQNYWCQIAVDMTARRKMSAKQIPNL